MAIGSRRVVERESSSSSRADDYNAYHQTGGWVKLVWGCGNTQDYLDFPRATKEIHILWGKRGVWLTNSPNLHISEKIPKIVEKMYIKTFPEILLMGRGISLGI